MLDDDVDFDNVVFQVRGYLGRLFKDIVNCCCDMLFVLYGKFDSDFDYVFDVIWLMDFGVLGCNDIIKV